MKERTEIWMHGDIAQVREGWDRAGTKFTVLGPSVFCRQWWVPVDDPEEEDPSWHKEAGLIRIDPKPDGRKVANGSAFPYRLTNAAKARVITGFEKRRISTHSPQGMTLGILLEHCHKNQINFRLIKVNHGYFLRKT